MKFKTEKQYLLSLDTEDCIKIIENTYWKQDMIIIKKDLDNKKKIKNKK